MTIIPQNVVDIFAEIFARVNTKLISQLKAYDTNIQAIRYDFGTVEEINQRLIAFGNGTEEAKKYPLCWLVCNFAETDNGVIGTDKELSINIILAKFTMPEYSTAERYEVSFNPILTPIYVELMKQIALHTAFTDAQRPKHTKTNEAYWGRDGVLGAKGQNILVDYIDAILITNLQLTLKTKKCQT